MNTTIEALVKRCGGGEADVRFLGTSEGEAIVRSFVKQLIEARRAADASTSPINPVSCGCNDINFVF